MLIKQMLLPTIKKRLPLFLIMLFVCIATTAASVSLISTYYSYCSASETYIKEYGLPDAYVEFNSSVKKEELKEIQGIDGVDKVDLRWSMILDNSFKEDRMRMKKGSASENMNLLRKFVLNVLALTNYKNESVSASRDNLKYDTP